MSESIKKNSPTLLPLTSKVGRDAIKKRTGLRKNKLTQSGKNIAGKIKTYTVAQKCKYVVKFRTE